jgi:hypothetical protein
MVNGDAQVFLKAALYREWELEQDYHPGTYWDERVLNTEHSALIDLLRAKLHQQSNVPIFNVGRMYAAMRDRANSR